MKFNIDGTWYDATSYAAAREMHKKAKGTPDLAAPPKLGAPKPVVAPPPIASMPILKPVVPRVIAPPAPVASPTGFSLPKKSALPIPAAPMKATTKTADSFDLTVFRGEKKAYWPFTVEDRLICGMTIYDPWNLEPGIDSMTKIFERLKKDINQNGFGKVSSYAQFLRATSRTFACATAWTEVGAFTSDYNYVLKFPNVRTFLWGPGFTLGAPAGYTKPSQVKNEFIVLNADTIAESTILGFGHPAGTNEITFMHDLRIEYVESCNRTQTEALKITNPADLSVVDRARLSKLIRYAPQGWL